MATGSPVEVNIESDTNLPSTETLDFDDATLRAIAEVNMNEGNQEYRKKEFNNAIHFYTEGIKVNCKDEELNAKLYSNRATAHFCVGNYTDTLSDAKAAIALRPTFVKAIVKGASACMELNLFEEALTWCAKGLSIDESNRKLLELKGRIVDEIYGKEETQIKGEGCHAAESTHKVGERTLEDWIDYSEKYLKTCKATGDREGEGQVYNKLGVLFLSHREYDKSNECFKKELAICKETGDREGECTCYINLGGVCFHDAQFENAIRYYEKGLEIANETGNLKGQKGLLRSLGVVHITLHQYERGIKYCKKALEIMKETGDNQGEGKLYNHLGQAYYALGLHEKSIKILEKALEINNTIGDEKQKFTSYHSLGRAYRAIGNGVKSTEYFEKAAGVSRADGKRKNEGCCYSDLGSVYEDMGQYEQSIEYHEKALLIAIEGAYPNEIATCYNNLGSVYSTLGLNEKSIEYYKDALQLHEATKDRKGEMTCINNLGVMYDKLGQYEKSVEYLEKGLAISKEIGNKEGETTSYNNLASVYTSLGQYEKSMEFLKKALASTNENKTRAFIYASLGKAAYSHWKYNEAIKYLERALEIMKECGLKGEVGILLSQLGISYALAPGDTSGANFEKARHYLLQSIKTHEKIREDLKDEFKISLDDQNFEQYEQLSWILALLQEVDTALCTAERGRARALEDLMSKEYAIQKRNDSHELKLHELSCLLTRQGCNFLFVAILMKTLFSFVTKPGTVVLRPDPLEANDFSTDVSQDLLHLVMRIFKSSHFRQQVDCEDRSLSKLYVSESSAFEEQVRETMDHFRGEDEDGQEESDLEADLCLLYKMIFAPVADLIEGPEIIICPEGQMFRIPFAALKDANGKYLAETFRLRLVPSLTTLKLIHDCPADYRSQTGALIVGDPNVSSVTSLLSLPKARSEVEMIARKLGVSPLVGDQATKQEVLTRIQEVSLVHIAAHGDAERGEIACAPNKSSHGIPKKEDFVLTMEDIAKVGIRAKLVVLSCCYSGCGKVLKSEGVVGIARAFLGSGARLVLVSLWAIYDGATEAFMDDFYTFLLRDKLSASEALHLSMKKMRESSLYSDIVYWAPFVLIGDDVTLDL